MEIKILCYSVPIFAETKAAILPMEELQYFGIICNPRNCLLMDFFDCLKKVTLILVTDS